MRQIYDGECLVMGGLKMHRRRHAHLAGFFPARGAQAPFVTGLEAGETELRSRRDQIIPAMKAVLQKLSRDRDADCVHPLIHRSRIAAAIPEKAGEGIMATVFEVTAQNVAGFCLCFTHAGDIASGLFAAELSTRQ